MAIILNAFEVFGGNQIENAHHVHRCVKQNFGGNWAVIVCPNHQKSYNTLYDVAHNQLDEDVSYTLVHRDMRYLIYKYPEL